MLKNTGGFGILPLREIPKPSKIIVFLIKVLIFCVYIMQLIVSKLSSVPAKNPPNFGARPHKITNCEKSTSF